MRAVSQLTCIMVAAAVASGSLHAAVNQSPTFDQALKNGDYVGAAKEIAKLVAQRPSGQAYGKWLDSYYGRFYAAAAQGAIAEPYLVRAIATSKNPEERDRLAFELARAREVDGYVSKAEVDYRRLAAGAEPAVRRDASLSLARLQLGADPQAAVTMLLSLVSDATPAPDRWEAHLLLSRAYSILNRDAEARSALEAAWQEAPLAREPADAIIITASDQAIDRAASGDRAGELGLISVGGSRSKFAGTAQLPVCGVTLRPEDRVTVSILADEKQRPIYSVVRASRPGIAQLFTVPLAVSQQHIDGSAIYVTLRCRTALDGNVRFVGGAMRDLSTWLAEKSSYPPLEPLDATAGDPLTQLKARLQTLEAKAGKDELSLTPTLLQLALMQGAQSRFGNTAGFVEAKGYADRALTILEKAEAPEEVLQQVRLQSTIALAQNGNIGDVAGPAAIQAMDAILARASTTPVQALSAFSSLSRWQLKPAQQLGLADTLIAFLDSHKVGQTDMIRQVAELRRASIMRDVGTMVGITERLAAHGLPADICGVADKPPSIPPSAITLTSDDYPKDLIRRDVTGLTAIELSVSATGTIEGTRVIASQPSGLFDAVAAAKLSSVTLLPAQRSNMPSPCRGMVQNVRWQVPFHGDFSLPFTGFPASDE